MKDKLNKIKVFAKEHHDIVIMFAGALTAATAGYYIGCRETRRNVIVNIGKFASEDGVMENIKITGKIN